MSDETQSNETSLQILDGIERAQIDMQIATAHRYPRTLSKVKADMMSFATLDEDTAASCFYTLPRGGKTIQGPSVRLAEIAVSCYGNLRAGSRIVSVITTGDNPHVVIQSVAHDLERNVAISIEKRRNITAKRDHQTGERLPVSADDINLAANACSAVAFRDAVYKVVPLALIKPVMEAAKKVAIGDASSLAVRRGKIIDRLKQMGALEERILAVVEARKIEDIGMDKLEILVGLGTAIKDGELSVDAAFPTKEVSAHFVPPSKDQTTAGGIENPTPERPSENPPPAAPESTPKTRGRRRAAQTQEAEETEKQPVPPPSSSENEIPFADPEPPVTSNVIPPPGDPPTVQQTLAKRLTEAGHTWDRLVAWNDETKWLKTDLHSLAGFEDLPKVDANRLLLAIGGLIVALNKIKIGL